MWNWQVSALACGATLALYDGSPFHPDGNALFDYVAEEGIETFGTSAKYIDAVKKAGLAPARTHDLSKLRAILSTGSPLVPESFDFVYESIKRGRLPLLHQRRHRHHLLLRGRQPRRAGPSRRDPVPGARARRARLRRRRAQRRRRQGRARVHPRLSVDARRLLERPRWAQVPRRLLRPVRRRLVPRRLRRDHRARRGDHLRALRRGAQPGAACASAPPRSTARSSSSRRWSEASGHRPAVGG